MDLPDVLAVHVWKGEIEVNAQRKGQLCKLTSVSSCQSKQVYLWISPSGGVESVG